MDPTAEAPQELQTTLATPDSPDETSPQPATATEEQVKTEKLKDNAMFLYLKDYRDSVMYRHWFNKFYEGKTIPPDVSNDYKRKVFENNATGITALYEFSRQQPFTYFAEGYPKDVQALVNEYIRVAREFKRIIKNPIGREALHDIDRLRSSVHNMVGDVFLDKGYVTTSQQGKLMAHLILTGMGIDQLAPPMSSTQYAQTMASSVA